MKKYLLLFLFAIIAMSCSKKVEVEGKIVGGSPLDRIELIDVSGIDTLPLINIGTDKTGIFKGSFEAPHSGMYVLNYAGRQAMVYIQQGETFKFAFNAMQFPENIVITGDAKANNDFLKDVTKSVNAYAQKVNMQALFGKDEAEFLTEAKKIKTDLEKAIDQAAEKSKPDSDVVKYKKDEATAIILGLLSQYEVNHPNFVQNPSFKVSAKFRDVEKELSKNGDELVKNQPVYRSYLLNKLSADYQQYTEANVKQDSQMSNSEIFAKYLDTRKDVSATAKDYLLAFVMGQFDLNPQMDEKAKTNLVKIIDTKIKDNTVKQGLKNILKAVTGPEIGATANIDGLSKQDGKPFKFDELKGKPSVVMFYASWNNYFGVQTLPVLAEAQKFYGAKMNFVFVNLDDTKDQFIKTINSPAMKGVKGINVFAEGGLASKIAKDWAIYSFKMPSFLIIDKEGKVATKFYNNLGENAFVLEMDKYSGLKAPQVAAPSAALQNDLLAPPMPQPQQAVPAEKAK